jgi:NAD(P)-dependent dehydrogenase (short-subunit alcohol dehydrogenase family)
MTGIAEPGSDQRLAGQTVLVIGGTKGMGLETARLARAEGADLLVTARDPERLRAVGEELGADTAAFDATDLDTLAAFLDGLPQPVDHVMLTGPGPYYAPLGDFDFETALHDVNTHLMVPIQIGKSAVKKVRPGGSLTFIGGTGGRRSAPGLVLLSALTAAMPALVRTLALEVAPVRAILI